jgi:hypothetical protein
LANGRRVKSAAHNQQKEKLLGSWNKFHAKRVTEDGFTFDSMAEASRYKTLKLLGIKNIEVHPKYEILPANGKMAAVNYVADFKYMADGRVVVEDVKGVLTEVFRIKAKMFVMKYPNIDFFVVMPTRCNNGFYGYSWDENKEYHLWDLHNRNKNLYYKGD